jgi:hypothetical protein
MDTDNDQPKHIISEQFREEDDSGGVENNTISENEKINSVLLML